MSAPTSQSKKRRGVHLAHTLDALEPRRLLASISGTIFYDIDLDGAQESGETGVAGWSVFADLNNNGQLDGNIETYDATDLPINLPDDRVVRTYPLSVSGFTGSIADADVSLDIDHSYIADLNIFLISPLGTRVELATHCGGGSDGYGITLDDEATSSIASMNPNDGPKIIGSFKPEGLLSALDGQSANGNWQLEIKDTGPGDAGVLNAWSITFRNGEASATSNVSGAYLLSGLGAGNVNVRIVPQEGFQTFTDGQVINLPSASSAITGVHFGVRQPPGTISGTVFGDYDNDGSRDLDEPGLAGRTVYIDTNDNSQVDSGERSTTTDLNGGYTFTDVPPGAKIVRTILPLHWQQTSPQSNNLTGGPLGVNSASTPISQTSRGYESNAILVSISNRSRLNSALAKMTNRAIQRSIKLNRASEMLKLDDASIVYLPLSSGQQPAKVASALSKLAGVEWAQPNYIYSKGVDPRELAPDDPSYGAQYFHPLMQNDLAWDITQGEGVLVGVVDDGLLLTHPDLVDNLYTNPNEIPNNAIDDDSNGFVDDVNGWDFTNSTTLGTGDNDVTPGVYTDDHGTHVAGIVAARTNNMVGVAGGAGRAKFVPIRFWGSGSWTSTVIFNSYKYATDIGCKIVTVSYNIDDFVNDNLYLQAINYMYDNGVLHFNSAGNSGFQNPARLKLDQTLYVSSTDAFDVRSGFSNYGWGIDITAPGSNIYSTSIGANLTTPSYEYKGGTSMSAPNAAATATLIWAAHPAWSREQVVAQLLGTADNIDAQNPSYVGQLGTGRVNSYKGVSQTLAAPKLRSVLGLPDDGAIVSQQPTQIQIRFFNLLDPASANNLSNWTLTGAGYDDQFGTTDDVNIPLSFAPNTSSTYRIGTNDFFFDIGQTLGPGTYRFEAKSSGLVDPFGNHLDGNGDGTGGDSFTRTFKIVMTTVAHVVEVDPNENLALDFGTRSTVPPTISSSIFEFETSQKIKIVFDRQTDLPISALTLQNLTSGQFITLSQSNLSYDNQTNTATIALNAPIASGHYILTLDADQVKDLYGNLLDGNADHTPGDDATITFKFLNADFNNSGTVGFEDLLNVAQHYGQNVGASFSLGDANYDGQINFDDLLMVAQSYGASLPVTESTKSRSSRSRQNASDILK